MAVDGNNGRTASRSPVTGEDAIHDPGPVSGFNAEKTASAFLVPPIMAVARRWSRVVVRSERENVYRE